MVEIYNVPGTAAMFDVQVWTLAMDGKQRIPLEEAVLLTTNENDHWTYTLPAHRIRNIHRLGLILTRVDPDETTDPVGAYTVEVYGM